jgi:hypothetical protein
VTGTMWVLIMMGMTGVMSAAWCVVDVVHDLRERR